MQLPAYIKNYDNFKPGRDQVLYSGPYWDELEMKAAVNSLLNGNSITSGENVVKFQKKFSKFFKVNFSHMVNSGSSANLVMIAALKKKFKWSDDSEIIVSPVGFPTTIAPIIQNKLIPRFIDIEFETLNFNIENIKGVVNSRTKAILVSPVLGNPPDIHKLTAICKQHNLLLIGDNCDSLGTKFDNRHISEYYYSWSCSFYPAHHICTGEGGMVSSNDEELINIVRSFSWWGRDCYCIGKGNFSSCGACGKRFDKWLDDYDKIIDHRYMYTNIGYNLKPLDLQGAIGLVQLDKFKEISIKRKKHKKIIENIIHFHTGSDLVMSHSLADVCWFGVPIILKLFQQKQSLVDFLEKNKIQTRNYFLS